MITADEAKYGHGFAGHNIGSDDEDDGEDVQAPEAAVHPHGAVADDDDPFPTGGPQPGSQAATPVGQPAS